MQYAGDEPYKASMMPTWLEPEADFIQLVEANVAENARYSFSGEHYIPFELSHQSRCHS
jgi:hypothetical protein